MRWSISQTATRETGSRPVVGSSRKKTRGSWTRPRAISTRRRMPPERNFTCLSAHWVSSTAASSSAISRRRFAVGDVEADAVDGGEVAELLDDVVDGDGGGGHKLTTDYRLRATDDGRPEGLRYRSLTSHIVCSAGLQACSRQT